MGSTTIALSAKVTDLDPLATDTVTWTWTQGGTVTQTGTGTFSIREHGRDPGRDGHGDRHQ